MNLICIDTGLYKRIWCIQCRLYHWLWTNMVCFALSSHAALFQHYSNMSVKALISFHLKTLKEGDYFYEVTKSTVTGSPHKSPCEWNEWVFTGCENILRHAPLQTPLLINLSALCFESNLVQPQEKHSAVSGAWLCFEGCGLLPSQSTARLCCKNTSS